MRWHFFQHIGIAVAGLLLLACGGSYADFAKKRDRAVCGALYRCCPGSAPQIDPRQPDEASCVATLDARIPAAVQQGIDSGALVFDQGAADRCIAAMTARWSDCNASDDPAPVDVACAAVLVGKSPIGMPCSLDTDCVAGAYCLLSGATSGSCVKLATAGESCGRCLAGSACLPSRTCGAPEPTFAECDDGSQCASGLCAQPCVVTGTVTDPNGQTHPVSRNDFCPLGCDEKTGECIVGTSGGMNMTSPASRCAPARTVSKALCVVSPSM